MLESHAADATGTDDVGQRFDDPPSSFGAFRGQKYQHLARETLEVRLGPVKPQNRRARPAESVSHGGKGAAGCASHLVGELANYSQWVVGWRLETPKGKSTTVPINLHTGDPNSTSRLPRPQL